MTRHVILAYGRETELWRAAFAVLSFYAWYEGDKTKVQTVVFTDCPKFFTPYFEELPVSYSLLTPAKLQQMQGPDHYIHRVKLAVVHEVFQNHPSDNLLFCDSDTFFVAKAEPLLQGLKTDVSFMHLREFTFVEAIAIYADFQPAKQDRFPRKCIELLEGRTFSVGGKEQQFSKNQYLWNSGVLGLHKSIQQLMPEICALNDAIYKGCGWITSEQIAFSLALPVKTQLLPTNQYVFHYWGKQQKALMDDLLVHLNSSYFRNLDLTKRLAHAKALTSKWWHEVQLNQMREGALYSLSKGQVKNGIKCAVRAIAAEPFDMAFTRELFKAFKKGVSS